MALEPEVAPDETPDVLKQEGVKLTQCSKFTRELSALGPRVITVQQAIFYNLKTFYPSPPLSQAHTSFWEEHVLRAVNCGGKHENKNNN